MGKQEKEFKKVLIVIPGNSAFRDPIEKALKYLKTGGYDADDQGAHDSIDER